MNLTLLRIQGRSPIRCLKCNKFCHAVSDTCSCKCCTERHQREAIQVLPVLK